MSIDLSAMAGDAFCYLTTTGRVSGRPHTIEIWFALHGTTLYMLSGGMDRADWVRNSRVSPGVSVKIREAVFTGQARAVVDPAEDALARRLIGEKYQKSEPDLDEWLRSSLPIVVDLIV